jgi:N6-L-threonylcarbamoyladenine synthase
MPTVLALETSCDESAAAIVRDRQVLASAVASQVEEHARWGGVVPEIASRRHVEALPQLIAQVCRESGLSLAEVDAVAATVAPGLVGALLVASITGRTLARLHGKSFLGVHHLEGHLASVHLGEAMPPGPHLVLLVSGGHTELVRVEGPGEVRRLGRSHDDAAGEAFDKVARLLGLGYPGGPAIQEAASGGDPQRFRLPRGRVSRPEGGFHPYDFSFSGLKTAMLRLVRSLEAEGSTPLPLADLAASFEQAVVEVLVERSCTVRSMRASQRWCWWAVWRPTSGCARSWPSAAAGMGCSGGWRRWPIAPTTPPWWGWRPASVWPGGVGAPSTWGWRRACLWPRPTACTAPRHRSEPLSCGCKPLPPWPLPTRTGPLGRPLLPPRQGRVG